MGQSILVTGGAGFLGAHLARALALKGERVVVYDNFSAGLPANLSDVSNKLDIVNGDTLDLSYLLQTILKTGVNRVIHTAALVGFAACVEKPALAAKVNLEGTINLLDAARIAGVKRFLDVSSEETYGSFQYEPADEDHPLSPTSPTPSPRWRRSGMRIFIDGISGWTSSLSARHGCTGPVCRAAGRRKVS